MERLIGYFATLGMVIGAIFGLGIGTANGSPLMGSGTGVLVGVFLGWFIAVIAWQRIKKGEDKSKL